MSNGIQYIDSIVTTINLNIFASIPKRHFYQKSSNEIVDNTQDYIELINKLQWHTCCSTSYCLRVKQNGQTSCRFEYLKENNDHTFIHSDNYG